MLVDSELIRRAQAGDSVAFNGVVAAYRRRILGTVARLIGRPEDVEDVAQEVFVRLYFSFDQLRSPEGFEPWLYRLTVNSALDYLRKKRRRREFRMADMTPEQVTLADARAGAHASHEITEQAKTRDFMESLLREVSDDDRTLLLLKEVEGLSIRDLENIYQVKENAIKVRLFRARQRVLKAFAKANPAAENGQLSADKEHGAKA